MHVRGITVLYISILFYGISGDVAARYVLSPGDEIVSVNGRQFAELSLYEAWNYLKALPNGVVSLYIKRRSKPIPVPPALFL